MQKSILFVSAVLFSLTASAQFCNPNGNLIIYSNYDGGTLNINIDQNIPNIRLGIISYEAVEVNISGAFVGNITAVEWAGYNANNGHCTPNVPTTVINGVSSSIVTQSVLPAATYSDPDGYSSIVCAYSCGAGNQGGCNTAIQIADYFINSLGGNLYYHYLQYGCWTNTLNVSDGGNCCDQASTNNPPVASFGFPVINYCIDDCVSFVDMSSNTPTTWSWTFSGGSPASSSTQNPTVCYNNSGTYSVSLTAQNAFGSDTYSTTITISSVNTSVSQAGTTLTAISSGATYQWLDCGNGNTAVGGATSQNFTPTQSGSYSLQITENGCTDTSGCLSVTVNGISDLNLDHFAKIYPNPSDGNFTLEIGDLELMGVFYCIENILGEVVFSGKINSSTEYIQMHGISPGNYFLKVNADEGMMVKKVVVE